eukprot:1900870-Rhodomonas_salina.1
MTGSSRPVLGMLEETRRQEAGGRVIRCGPGSSIRWVSTGHPVAAAYADRVSRTAKSNAFEHQLGTVCARNAEVQLSSPE